MRARSGTPHGARVVARAILAAALSVAATTPHRAGAQNLGPYRQFLSIEPYYTYLRLDAGEGVNRMALNGYGGRLWINLAPFSGPHWNLPSHGGIALFATYYPTQKTLDAAAWHYGAQHDLFFTNRPYGGFFDPFLSVAGGVFHIESLGQAGDYGTVSPGGGFRIPIPNRLQLRFDARDAIIFNTPSGANGAKRTTNNLEVHGAIGITF